MNRLPTIFLATALLTTGAAHAQGWGPGPQERREMHQDVHDIHNDRRNVRELEDVLSRYDEARSRRDEGMMRDVEGRLRDIIRLQMEEGHDKLEADKREVRRDERVMDRDSNWGRDGATVRDSRDRRDDIRDARRQQGVQQTRASIAREMSSLVGSRRPGDMDRMRGLINQLIDLTRSELHEDKRELREDRHR